MNLTNNFKSICDNKSIETRNNELLVSNQIKLRMINKLCLEQIC